MAENAAKRTLGSKPSPLPFNDDPGTPGALQGRRRLNGAFLIETSRIRPDPDQPRRIMDEQKLGELMDSINRLGILQPIGVRYVKADDHYLIISGERRFHAAIRLGLTELPCWVQDPEEQEILVRQIAENWQRADLHPFELADSLAKLRDANGYSQKKIAEVIGKSEPEVSKLLKLLDLAPEVQREARTDTSGVLSRRHLYAMSRLPAEEQIETADAVQRQGLSAVDTETLVAKKLQAARRAPKRGAPLTRVQFVTTKAVIQLTFRKQVVERQDILAALKEAQEKASETKESLNILRQK